jgi:D-lactate dehydrogenase
MRTAVFSTKSYDRQFLAPAAATAGHELEWFEPRLASATCPLADGFPAICTFVNDTLDAANLQAIYEGGTRFVALRCAGFNQVDLAMAAELGIQVARVPAYSPYAVAEHTVGLILALNRKLYKAYNRVREGNFSLDQLLGFDLRGKTVGIFGTGQIGTVTARIMHGFDCRLLLVDVHENDTCRAWGTYVSREQLFAESDIISLHCPLLPQTHHLIDNRAIDQMKPGVMLINTSRGALIDTRAVINGLKTLRIAYLGLDVYEEEADLFFEDLSGDVIQDDVFARLLTFPNVLVTAHQAFFTSNALAEIARVTMTNLTAFAEGQPLTNAVTVDFLKK